MHVPAARAPRALLRRPGAGAGRVQAGQAAKGQDGRVVGALLQLAAGCRALLGILRAFSVLQTGLLASAGCYAGTTCLYAGLKADTCNGSYPQKEVIMHKDKHGAT